MFEELITRGTVLNQVVLWMLFVALVLLAAWSLVDILYWCWQWWKGEDNEESDCGDDDCGDDLDIDAGQGR